ncbi:MAG: VTT domain-containing protein [bacterium]|nr:VTT domain-containing protein [bacterium]
MTPDSFAQLVSWVIAHGYTLFFIAAFLEGPIVTAAAGVAAFLGYFNIGIIITLSILGDLCADLAYYIVGYFSGKSIVSRYGKYFGMGPERRERIQELLHRHAGKTLAAIKLSPLVAVPGILLMGYVRVPVKKFIKISLLVTFPKSLLFAGIGFYSGKAYEHVAEYVANTQYIIFGATFFAICIYAGYKKLAAFIAQKIERI